MERQTKQEWEVLGFYFSLGKESFVNNFFHFSGLFEIHQQKFVLSFSSTNFSDLLMLRENDAGFEKKRERKTGTMQSHFCDDVYIESVKKRKTKKGKISSRMERERRGKEREGGGNDNRNSCRSKCS